MLYPAARSAVVHNPAMRAFEGRLAARGKRAKVILTAVARKRLVIANAIPRPVSRGGQKREWRRPIRYRFFV